MRLVRHISLLLWVVSFTACSHSQRPAGLYTDAEAQQIAKRATGLIPNGTTKTKREVFDTLRIDPRRIGDLRVTGPYNHVYFERGRLSPSHAISWMMATQDTTPHESSGRRIYGLRILPYESR
jgi:hypothetical protein